MAAYQKYDADVPEGHPSVETRTMNSKDILLRRAGFKILRRSKDGEAVWTRRGKEYAQSEALDLIARKPTSMET